MNQNPKNPESLSPNKQALLKIRELKQQLADLQRGAFDDIAIVSMACRFPRHSQTPEQFWDCLIQGRDESTEIPGDRWELDAFFDANPEVPGKMYARRGVFLERIDLMDPEFFGISPREATWVDPQQRLLMEVGWEALERAGWAADQVGRGTGIYVGWMHNDYQNEASDSFLNLNPYIATGAAGSFLSGRLAYYLGLEGPSVAVDTACSSSLVALHLACQGLHRRDCDRALVGGVNAIVSPTTNILTCKLNALSPSGRSRAFDAAADGYVRGEGCGVVTLRRLEDARRAGDPIIGIIRGSSVGHNGSGGGLTVPNARAQERVIRQALERAGIDPSEVAYLEAHGTGTELGDPIEIQAAAAALTKSRSDKNRLLVGSVKTNVGHLEAAAGMAGLIKVLLAFENSVVPQQINFDEPNPHIPWDRLPLDIVVAPTDWPQRDRRIAGVSAFGMSGTNAHVVLEAPPQAANSFIPGPVSLTSRSDSGAGAQRRTQPTPESSAPQLFVFSAQTDEALQELAANYRRWFSDNDFADLPSLAYTLGVGRKHFERRAAIVAENPREVISGLAQLESSGSVAHLIQGRSRNRPKVAWQFTGQGSQYVGMARGLYDWQPVFRDVLNDSDELLREWRGESLLEVIFEDGKRLEHTSWTQPAIFAVQRGLAQLLASWGLVPDVVLGHSVGQYAAACVAGILSWKDGLWLISERGRLIGALPEGGAMLAVFAPAAEVMGHISGMPSLSLAASNGSHAVVSGPATGVEELAAQYDRQGVRCKRLSTSHAFHSALMEPALNPFRSVADQIHHQSARIPLICNVSGKLLPHDKILDGEYWERHIRQPVQYAESLVTASEFGCDVVVELGPQSVLTHMAAAAWSGDKPVLTSCLQKDRPDEAAVLSAVGQFYTAGVTPDFSKLDSGQGVRRIVLPTYPFQRRRFWGPAKPRAAHAEFHTAHPLLGSKCLLAGLPNETRYESFIEPDSPPWLPDHEVLGDSVFPGAAFVELAMAAAQNGSLQELVFEHPLRPAGRTAIQTVVRPTESGLRSIEVFSSPAGSGNWSRNFKAEITSERMEALEPVERDSISDRCDQTASSSEFYRALQEVGLNYGPQFQTVQSVDYSDREVLAHLKTAADLRGYAIPPTLLDGALHSLAVGLLHDSNGSLFLPVGMQRFDCYGAIDSEAWCHAEWIEAEGGLRTANVSLMDNRGHVQARIHELRLRRLDRAALRKLSGSGAQRLMFELQWKPYRLPAGRTDTHCWLVVGSGDQLHEQTTALLREQGHRVVEVQLEGSDGVANDGRFRIDVEDDAAWNAVLEQLREREPELSPEGVVWLLADSGTPGSLSGESTAAPLEVLSRARPHCAGLVGLASALRRRKIGRLECGFQMVTRRGVSIDQPTQSGQRLISEPSKEDSVDPSQAQFWGLGRVIGAEHPELQCRLIDLDASRNTGATPSSVKTEAELLGSVILNDTAENQVAIQGGQYWVPRLAPVNTESEASSDNRVRADASYLITGGLGMLGRQAAMWLATQGAGQVVLASRRAPSESAMEWFRQVEELGCRVEICQADFSLRAEVDTLFQRFGVDLLPLRGVIHAAGILDDGLLTEQSWERFEKVMAPKVCGAWLLHELTRELPLDFFVLYSSAASVLGSPGQSNYATANAYLDGLAWMRRSQGLPALSINWGPWTEGMADDEQIVKRLALQGITPLSASEAHDALEKMLHGGLTQTTVMDVDWRRMKMGMGGETPMLLADIVPASRPKRQSDSEFVSKLKALTGQERRDVLVASIRSDLQEILSTPDPPETDRPLIEMGLDSLMAVEFGTRLQQQVGDELAIAPTMLFDHPTIDAISDHVLKMLSGVEPEDVAESVTEHTPEATAKAGQEDVAIIGMSCRFPGARSLDGFWSNLINGVDSVGEIPADRWDIERFYDPAGGPGKMISREGGFLENVGDFDADFFNISATEACWMDPQHRLLLETSWTALEEAGIATSSLEDKNVGVFMGIMSSDYAFLPSLDDEGLVQDFQGAGFAHSAGVGRVSHTFGFEGPSLAIDSASSSSLVAVCQAMRSLQDGNCSMALAGGVNAILAPVNSLLMTKAGLLAPDGRSKSFSADANGFGRGEGCGVIVMKRMSDAVRNGDTILAVIRGGAIGHNGSSAAITAPSSRAQAKVIAEACRHAGIAPTEVQYLEAHGTGTEYGDPMEVGAAMSVLGKGRNKDSPLLIGSVKANISHLEAAGGISGLIKTVLAMHHGVIPPQIHFDQPSPHIPWARLPLQVVTEATPWPAGEPRVAGVTALGLSGTNAHVVLSRSTGSPSKTAASTEPERSHHLLVFSGRDEQALEDLAGQYHALFRDGPNSILADVCHTAAVGRKHFERRAALVLSSNDQATELLRRFSDTNRPSESRATLSNQAQSNGKPRVSWFRKGVAEGSPKIAWYFGGRLTTGSVSATRKLYQHHPVFRNTLDRYDAVLQEAVTANPPNANSERAGRIGLRSWLVEDVATADGGAADEATDLEVFAVQAAMSSLWRSWGIEPDAVLGFGIGQYSAACVAGGLAVEDALRLVLERENLRSDFGIGGDHMKPESEQTSENKTALDRFEVFADSFNYYPPNRALVCGLTGEIVPVHRSLAGGYWRRHCTQPAAVADSLQALTELKCSIVLNIGAELEPAAAEQLGHTAEQIIASLHPHADPLESLLDALGCLYVSGCDPDFKAFDAPWPRKKTRLPTYPFRRQRFWITDLAEHVGK